MECRAKRNFSMPRQTSNGSSGGGTGGVGPCGTYSGPGGNIQMGGTVAAAAVGASSVVSMRNRSISRSSKRNTNDHPKVKQKGTQTEIYDDLFVSDEESLTSNEDAADNNMHLSNEFGENGKSLKQMDGSNLNKYYNESLMV